KSLNAFLREFKPLWIAASTMPGEDELVLEAFQQLLRSEPDLKLLIAPRHPDRFDTVANTLTGSGLHVVRRSRIGGSGNVLLLDSIGELSSIFQYANVVYMGGTLVPTGGHNILEPARHSKPIVFGPHMENFRDIAGLFLDSRAAVQI